MTKSSRTSGFMSTSTLSLGAVAVSFQEPLKMPNLVGTWDFSAEAEPHKAELPKVELPKVEPAMPQVFTNSNS